MKLSILTLMIPLLAGSLVACGGAEETPTPTPVVPVEQPDTVSAEAFVVPVRQANLAFETAGRIKAIQVQEGASIQEGKPLIELDNASQTATLAKAQAGLANAQATLADVQAGATPEEIAQAQAGLAAAEASLAHLLAGPTEEEIAQAKAAVNTAFAQLKQVKAGTRQEQIEAAAARLLQTESDVRLAQADYDKYVFGDPKVAEPYGVALEKATLAHEAAQADYNALVNGATPEEVAVAQSAVNEAQAALNRTLAGATPEQIAQAQAEVASAEATLAKVKAGATAEKLAIAQAGVQAAQADVQAAQAELAKTILVAPFTGEVGVVRVEVGEMVSPGTEVVSLGDTTQWQIETDDLTEIDVVRVNKDQLVDISVDALPDQQFQGRVVRITPQSETKAGDVTYTVLIGLADPARPDQLRWGMTTFVDIHVESERAQN